MPSMSPVPRIASPPGVVRLDVLPASDSIEVRPNGVLILTSAVPDEVAAKHADLGVRNPRRLVDAVDHFDAVEIDQSKAGWA